MPKIPSYDGQQVQARPLQAPRIPTDVPLDAFGGGQSTANAFGAAANIGNTIEQIAGQEYQKQYRDAVNQQSMEMASKITQEETRLKQQMMGLAGPDAQKYSNDIGGDLEKFYQNLGKSIQNDDVRKGVQGHYLQTQNALDAWAHHTADVKMKQYDATQFESSGKTLLDSVSVDPSQQNVVTAAAGRKIAIQQFAERNGLPQEWVAQQQAEQASKIYLAGLEALIPIGDLAAKNFYDINKEDFVGQDAIHAAKLVEANSYRGQAQREVMRILMGRSPEGDGPPKPATEKESFDDAYKIEDPKLQDMVVDRLRERWADQKRIAHDAEVADTTDVANMIEKNPSLDAIPIDLYERLTPSARTYVVKRIAQIKKGMGPQAVSDEYLKYTREAGSDPDTFVKRNFAAMRDEITDEEAKELTKEQAKIISGDERSAMKRSGFMNLEKIANLRLKTLGVTDEQDKEDFLNALNRDYYGWKADPKNANTQLPPEEAQKMVSRLLAERKRWWWKNTYDIRKIDDVPAADRAAISNQLLENGETPTEGRIIEIYNKGK